MKQRIFLQRHNTDEYVYLAWFELRPTHDLYWGLSMGTIDHESTFANADEPGGRTVTLKPPDDWDKLPLVNVKHSYHRMGRRHASAGGSGRATIRDSRHTPLSEITEPTLICALITGVAAKQEKYLQSLNRNNCRAVILELNDDQWFNSRLYIEFLITPSGRQRFPQMWIDVSPRFYEKQPAVSSFSQELDRLLAVRHVVMPLPPGRKPKRRHPGFLLIPNIEVTATAQRMAQKAEDKPA
ncbi:hypothetical protein BST36_00275 [Mycolicibacterium moriokaense]|uniref:Uncharacterized protein n=1 Tax=Mycolicibacterium moriokaense TaxID=39691 RepID=A0AAD1H8U6_9MYCO|nr:hypothetical protein [Mycolicibacterium moriokaense]MCV7041243.1 hypothetical protein [Mycolicibacterium moriokaense]ORB27160.1 hypothetical protein BST36_00275 [Mycolicibacterium moriokaense]BBX00807.1 hypothetical protein MMOR_17430 [Mycolicibacterium moriokaense]